MTNCPFCNALMEKGYIDQTHIFYPLRWSPVERESGFFVSSKRAVKLTSSMRGGRVAAYRCEACRKIIIDELENGK